MFKATGILRSLKWMRHEWRIPEMSWSSHSRQRCMQERGRFVCRECALTPKWRILFVLSWFSEPFLFHFFQRLKVLSTLLKVSILWIRTMIYWRVKYQVFEEVLQTVGFLKNSEREDTFFWIADDFEVQFVDFGKWRKSRDPEFSANLTLEIMFLRYHAMSTTRQKKLEWFCSLIKIWLTRLNFMGPS